MKSFIWSLVKHCNQSHKTDIFYEFQHKWGLHWRVDQTSCLLFVMCGFCSVRTAISFILHTAEDGWLMTSTSGISICPLHRPACVHLLHCSKKHFPFSVVSLTQKTHTCAQTRTLLYQTHALLIFSVDFHSSANLSRRGESEFRL